MKTANEIVDFLTHYYHENNDHINNDGFPDQINDQHEKLTELFEVRFGNESPYANTWQDFISLPLSGSVSAALVGTLEAIFEAEPDLRRKADSLVSEIVVIEARDRAYSPVDIESSMHTSKSSYVEGLSEGFNIGKENIAEQNSPIYGNENEKTTTNSDKEEKVSSIRRMGNKAEIIYMPNRELKFPFLFMQLGRISTNLEDLTTYEKEIVGANLEEIWSQLSGDQPFDKGKMAAAFNLINEIDSSYADALIESLEEHVDEIPSQFQGFISEFKASSH